MTGWFMSAIAACYFCYPFMARRLQGLGSGSLALVYGTCAAYCILAALTLPIAVIALAVALTLIHKGIFLFIAAAFWPPLLLLLVFLPIGAPGWLKWVGERAFILYALHWPLYVYVKGLAALNAKAHAWLYSPMGTAGFLVFLLLVAEVARRLVEQPALRLLRAR